MTPWGKKFSGWCGTEVNQQGLRSENLLFAVPKWYSLDTLQSILNIDFMLCHPSEGFTWLFLVFLAKLSTKWGSPLE